MFGVSVRLCCCPLSRTLRSNLFIFTNNPLFSTSPRCSRGSQSWLSCVSFSSELPLDRECSWKAAGSLMGWQGADWQRFPARTHPSPAESAGSDGDNNSVCDQVLSQSGHEAAALQIQGGLFCLLHHPLQLQDPASPPGSPLDTQILVVGVV